MRRFLIQKFLNDIFFPGFRAEFYNELHSGEFENLFPADILEPFSQISSIFSKVLQQRNNSLALLTSSEHSINK